MLTRELKDYIKNQCLIPQVGVASVAELNAEEIASLQVLNRKMSKFSPHYDPQSPVFQPGDFLDDAKAIVVLGLNLFFGKRDLPGSPPRAEIMNFYVNPDCLTYVTSKTELVTSFLNEKGYQAMTVANGIPIKIIAARTALGRYGKNAVIQNPAMGSWLGLALIITDAPLEIDATLEKDCGDCRKCQDACPTGALAENYECDIERCLTLHMIYNRGPLPYDIREQAGTGIAHCNQCLYACPANANVPQQTEVSVPEHLVYPEIVPLVNLSQDRFEQMFGGTFMEFIIEDKKYLQRNACVALGNLGDPQYVDVLEEALTTQPEELVRGHAAWALGKIGTPEAKALLEKQLAQETADYVKEEISYALAHISA